MSKRTEPAPPAETPELARPAVPQHRQRPLLAAGPDPIETRPTAHGLTVRLYPPAAGTCGCCRRKVDRLTRDERRCLACTASCWTDTCAAAA